MGSASGLADALGLLLLFRGERTDKKTPVTAFFFNIHRRFLVGSFAEGSACVGRAAI